jgi:hypothetical protein
VAEQTHRVADPSRNRDFFPEATVSLASGSDLLKLLARQSAAHARALSKELSDSFDERNCCSWFFGAGVLRWKMKDETRARLWERLITSAGHFALAALIIELRILSGFFGQVLSQAENLVRIRV